MKIIRRVLAVLAITLTTCVLMVSFAAAHNPYVKPYCGGLGVALEQYEDNAAHTNNHVKVVVDGVKKIDVDFGGGYGSRDSGGNPIIVTPWSQTEDHTYTVTVNANIHSGDPTAYDATFTGGWTKCVIPTTTSTSTTTTTTTIPPTTTLKPTTTSSSTTSSTTTTTSTTQPVTTTSTTVPATTTTQPAATTTTTQPTTTVRGSTSTSSSTSSTTSTVVDDSTTTTTTVPVSTSSTTIPAATSSSSTTSSTTTTTQPPVVAATTTTTKPIVSRSLPVTGIELTHTLFVAFSLVIVGGAIWLALRRPRSKKSA